ncbi:MAG: DUF2269 domain-containing protein [Chloroflexota bacterium]
MGPGLRKLALATHLSFSVGWIGAVAAYLTLDVTVATVDDVQILRAAWVAMGLVVTWAIVPLAIASLVTGFVMALGTKWGLFRHWWVAISLLLTLAATLVLLQEAGVIAHAAAMAAEPTTSDAELRNLPSTLPHSGGGLTVLLVIQVMNVYKPQALTPYGWRKQEEERLAAKSRSVMPRAAGGGRAEAGRSPRR